MKYERITPTLGAPGTRRYQFVHEGRTGVVAGSAGYWLAGWVSPLRSGYVVGQPRPTRQAAVEALIGAMR
jgi:hypothetical protein